MIYDLINPSDEISFEAEEHRAAICAVMMVGQGSYAAEAVGEGLKEFDIPMMLFANPEPFLKKWFGEDDVLDWMRANKPTVAKVLRSFLYGKPSERAKNTLVADIEKSQDEKRSSMNNIRGRAFKLADGLMTTP